MNRVVQPQVSIRLHIMCARGSLYGDVCFEVQA